jgi:hypothetical protein
VARSYIQGREYTDDVAELLTLGTPHRGSAEAYYTWGGGDFRSDPNARTVFQVYLWYLRHVHPFQTDLDPLKTVRTQVPSIRDLLPIDDYVVPDGAAGPLPELSMRERNLVVEVLNQPGGIETLLGRVAVTTMAGTGLNTIRGVRVSKEALSGDSPAFPDGKPLSDVVEGSGDGTVLILSAAVGHPKAQNTPPLPNAGHGDLPNNPTILTQVFKQIGVTAPALGAAPPQEPKLVIMTASPVKLAVRTPGGAPLSQSGVLGAAAEQGPPQRSRTVRGKDHGHTGKHLNIAVIPQPPPGDYQVSLTGTATGAFAVGAMLVSSAGATLLGATADGDFAPPMPTATPVATRRGQVASGAEVYFTVTVSSLDATPVISLDAQRTAANALERLRDATGGVLGASREGGDPVSAALGASGDPLTEVDALIAVAETTLGGTDPGLAQAIIAQLRAAQG